MSVAWCTPLPCGVRLAIQVAPNARKTEVMGVFDAALKIRLQAQPIEGRANEALVRYLAEMLDVPRSAVTITHGVANKRKTVEIESRSLTAEAAARILLAEEK